MARMKSFQCQKFFGGAMNDFPSPVKKLPKKQDREDLILPSFSMTEGMLFFLIYSLPKIVILKLLISQDRLLSFPVYEQILPS